MDSEFSRRLGQTNRCQGLDSDFERRAAFEGGTFAVELVANMNFRPGFILGDTGAFAVFGGPQVAPVQ